MTAPPPEAPRQTTGDRARLASFLKNRRSRPAAERDGIPTRSPNQLVEATEAQQQIWLHAELAQAPLYNEPITIHYDGELDVAAFERAFNSVLDRHEAWRTSFEWRDGKLMQIVADHLTVTLPVNDLRSLPSRKREAAALNAAREDSKRPFALDQLPLFRGRLCRMADDRYRFYLTLQHIIFDGVSLYRIFLPELQAFYKAFHSGTVLLLPPLERQFADFALHSQLRAAEDREQLIKYWTGVLSRPAPPLALPFDFPRPVVRSFAGEMAKFALSRTMTASLKEVGERGSATLFMTLLAAYHVLLYSYTGACDQPVGTATSSRKHELTQGMLGLFLNTVVLRSSFSREETFVDLLAKVRETVVGALMHDDISFGELVTLFEKNRVPGLNPLFQLMFSLEPPLSPLEPGWRFTQMDVETSLSKYDLHLEMDEREDELIGRFIYSVELFREQTIEELKARWLRLLDLISKNPLWTIEQLAAQSQEANSAEISARSFWQQARNLFRKAQVGLSVL